MPNDRDRWNERYIVNADRMRDCWRNADCEQLILNADEVSIPKLKALQLSDHPGLPVITDFWVDDAQCVLVHDATAGVPLKQWLLTHPPDEGECHDLILQYVSILIYGRTLSPPFELTGLHEFLRIIPTSYNRLVLSAAAHARIVGVDAGMLPEADALKDVEAFAASLGASLPPSCTTLAKLRNALKNAQLQ